MRLNESLLLSAGVAFFVMGISQLMLQNGFNSYAFFMASICCLLILRLIKKKVEPKKKYLVVKDVTKSASKHQKHVKKLQRRKT